MSIIEKAVRSARSGREKRKQPGDALPSDQVDRPAEESIPLIVDTRRAAEQGMITLDAHPQLAKDFRFLKRPILARVFGMTPKSADSGKLVMITSHSPQVGKSFVAYNLAVSMAFEQMTHVLLIDADPFRQTLTQVLGLGEQIGLQEVLSDRTLSIKDAIVPTDMPALQILPAGKLRPDSTELFASRRMSELLDSLHDPDLVVLLDVPPLRETSEGRALVEKADHSLVVVGAGRTTANQISSVLKMFESSQSSVSFVLNQAAEVKEALDDAYYPYYSEVGMREADDSPPVTDEA